MSARAVEHSVKRVALVAALLGCASAHAGDRVVAVGDLHGDLGGALRTLHLAGVVNDSGHWSGGQDTLVQTGDTTDRGPDSRAVMDLLRRLQQEATAQGGRVVCLLGNHEVMNLQGDWRYVDPGDIRAFGSEEARREAFSPGGAHGDWLRSLDVATRVGDTVFVHGGLAPTWARLGLDELNRTAREALHSREATILGPTGPVWFRGYVQEPEAKACPALQASLDALGARRMVVGHTTQRSGEILTRCHGRLHAIDTGIAAHYGSRLSAWEEVDGDARALYPSGPTDLEDPP